MTVDITELVDNLKAEVNIPGGDAFADAIDADWEIRLVNAFWDVVLDGLISATQYTIDEDGIISPLTGTTDLSRELQQIVVFYAGISVVRNAMRTLNSMFKAKAGPVEFEVQNAATVMRDLLAELVRRRNIILTRLSDVGITSTYYIDAVLHRNDSLMYGGTSWVGYEGSSWVGYDW